MGDIRDLWDAGNPQAPAGFVSWGEGVSDVVDDVVEDLDPGLLDTAEVTSGTEATLTLTVPAGVTAVRVVGVMRSDGAALRTNLLVSVNSHSASNAYRGHRFTGEGTAGVAGAGIVNDARWELGTFVPAANAASNDFGSVDILLPGIDLTGRQRVQWLGGYIPGTAAADFVTVYGQGRVTQGMVSTIQLAPFAGDFVTGTRFELRAA